MLRRRAWIVVGFVVSSGCYKGLPEQDDDAFGSSGLIVDSSSGDELPGATSIGDDETSDTPFGDDSSEGASSDPGSSDDGDDESTGGEPLPEDTGYAHGITISRVQANQGAASTLFDAGQVTAPTVRLLEQRRTLFSAWWTVDATFVPRDVVGRLRLFYPDGTFAVLDQTVNIAGATTLDMASPHFQWDVPAAQLPIGTQVTVSLLEVAPDGTAGEPAVLPRVPAQGRADLGLDATPERLRLMLVPYRHVSGSCNSAAAVDANVVAQLQQAILSNMPFHTVEITVHAEVTYTGAMIPNDGVLQHLTDLRASEAPADDIFYYGYLNPCEQVADGSCGGGLAWSNGNGTVVSGAYRAAVGGPPCAPVAGYEKVHLRTMVHELSHNLGRAHVVCTGTEGQTDPNYPYSGGVTNTWGWDVVTGELHGPGEVDYMGYCGPPTPWWNSDYGWNLTASQANAVNTGLADVDDGDGDTRPRLLLAIHPDGRQEGRIVSLPAPEREDAQLEVRRADQVERQWAPAQRLYVADSEAEHYVVELDDLSAVEGLTLRSPSRSAPLEIDVRRLSE